MQSLAIFILNHPICANTARLRMHVQVLKEVVGDDEFNLSQSLGLDINRHIAIDAGASGKDNSDGKPLSSTPSIR